MTHILTDIGAPPCWSSWTLGSRSCAGGAAGCGSSTRCCCVRRRGRGVARRSGNRVLRGDSRAAGSDAARLSSRAQCPSRRRHRRARRAHPRQSLILTLKPSRVLCGVVVRAARCFLRRPPCSVGVPWSVTLAPRSSPSAGHAVARRPRPAPEADPRRRPMLTAPCRSGMPGRCASARGPSSARIGSGSIVNGSLAPRHGAVCRPARRRRMGTAAGAARPDALRVSDAALTFRGRRVEPIELE